jgi:drug/metabolite transporter (DMT)-like permease
VGDDDSAFRQQLQEAIAKLMPNSVENRSAGIAWMLATMGCFISLDATMKYAMQTYSLVEVTWGRFFFATICAVLVCGRNLLDLAQTKSPGLQSVRSLLLMATTGLFNVGISALPLPTCTTIMFMSPILVTMLSSVVLHEHVGWRRWSGIAIGFCGALVVIRIWETGLSGVNHGAIFVFGAAATNATYQIFTRKLRGENPLTSLLFTAVAGAVITSFILPWHWAMPNAFGWALLIACGVFGCAGHLFLIKAFTAAPVSVVAPFSYSSLLWATFFGFTIWGDLPKATTLIGAAMIIGSGLYIFLRERKLAAVAAT